MNFNMSGPWSGKRFLVVDDHRFSLHLVLRMLRQLQAREVACAVNGEEALTLLRQSPFPFDCIISDCKMAPVNGLTLVKKIRTAGTGQPHNTPVIMLTAFSYADLVGAAMALDVNAFILKPLSLNMLRAKLQRVMGGPPPLKEPQSYDNVAVPRMPGEPGETDLIVRKPRRGRPLAIGTVPEGTVLAEDIIAANGALILSAGTQLTVRVLERLQDLREVGITPDRIFVAEDG